MQQPGANNGADGACGCSLMGNYQEEAIELRSEVERRAIEAQGLRNEVTQLRMELSLERQAREEESTKVQVGG
jgi:hypothetical protein